jgi:glycosyltransferase involved in cell wall biosynthesis
VLLEALASGLPIAAYPVPGPLDVIEGSGCGVLDHDLERAMAQALAIPHERCSTYAGRFSWLRCAEQFLGHLQRIEIETRHAQ